MSTYSLDVQYRENLHIHIKRAHSGRSFSSNLYYNWSHNNCILFDSQWFGKENSLHPVIINRSWICQTHFLWNKCVMYAWRSLTKHSFRPQSQPCLPAVVLTTTCQSTSPSPSQFTSWDYSSHHLQAICYLYSKWCILTPKQPIQHIRMWMLQRSYSEGLREDTAVQQISIKRV